ncbi:MAG: sigma factor-like helix-turn-helix DNA-binding protein, partial [Bacilli bacterium]
WEQEAALSLTFVDEETGEELAANIPDPTAQLDYEAVELRIWLHVLPNIERAILWDLYVYDLTQRETAQHCHISQKQVSRLHRHALETLRRELP